ncbi:MAG: hypothetical protein IKP28_06120 [Clostridia bacterium]|nr:hypothetical protein [Clostridia bacterium]
MGTLFVNPNYTYNMMQMDIEAIQELYPFIKVVSIGKSVLGKDLTVIKIGNGPKEVFYNAAIHANEWITSPILMKFAMEYCFAVANNLNIYEYNAKDLFDNVTLYLAPMVNPDGVDLVTGVINSGRIFNNAKKISESYPSISFPDGWKANINGVDLNLQFPARLE